MIQIRIYERAEVIERIRITGHATGKYGKRICTAISVLSRVLLHVLEIDSIQSPNLKWGSFDVSLDRKRKTQAAAQHTVAGYRMVAGYVPHQVRMRTTQLDGVRNARGTAR